jgi:lipid II:glycine glycyltransferase (peptidoglycan interpeptide bridge formation enzyme)
LGDPAHWPPLFDALRAFELPISLLGLDDTVAGADARLATIKRARWHGVDLEDGGAGTLWSRLASSARRAIRKATREGVVVERVDDEHFLREFHRMHVAVRKRKYRMLAQPAAFFAAIRRQFASLEGWLPLAAWHRGRCVAATIFLTWGDTLYYRFNTSEPEALGVRPNDLLLWEGIRLAAARGLRCVDLGRSDDDQPGLIRFKRQFGAREREIRHLRYLPPRYAGERDAETRRLLAAATHLLTEPAVPDDVTAAAGTALYRFFA